MQKGIINILIAVLLLAFISGCEKDKVDEQKKAVPVMIYEAKPDSIVSYIKLTGGLEAETDLDLYAMTSEKIKNILVKEGDIVEEGQLLLEQKNDLSQQGVKLAEAGLASARAQYNLAEKEFIRIRQLFQEEAVTQQQFDQTEMQFEAAKAGLELAEVQLEQAKEQLKYSRIYAPAAGEVAMIYFEEGEMAAAGIPLLKLVSNSGMKAILRLPGIDINKVSLNQPVSSYFSSYPETEFKGRIVSIDRALDPVSRTLEISVLLENGEGKLWSGLFGEFRIITEQSSNAIVLSDKAILTKTRLHIDNDGRQITRKEYYVFVEKDLQAIVQPVKTGIHSMGRIEINEGLNFGDHIIVVGQNIVKDGDEVKIVTN